MSASAADGCSPSCSPHKGLVEEVLLEEKKPRPFPPASSHGVPGSRRGTPRSGLSVWQAISHHKQPRHTAAEVDKFINDNNEDDEDDNINN